MNYDLNEGIPPYDLPFEGTPNDGSENQGSIDLPPQDGGNPSYDGGNAESSYEEVPSEYTIEPEDIFNSADDNDNIPAQVHDKHYSKVILPIIIMVLVLVLGTVLYFKYGSEMNFSGLTAKNTEDTQTDDITSRESLTGENESAEDINKILSETSEIIEVDMLKNRHNQSIQSNLDDDVLVKVNEVSDTINDMDVDKVSQNEKIATLQTSIPRGNIGRLDPFNPAGSSNQLFDVLLPPSNPTPDVEAQQLMTLKISGIMYTPDSPSALINIAGDDQLVRRGDKFNGFSVEGITKDKVTVRNGKNTYTASVGESLNVESVGVNAIPNLNKKFAGPYSKGNGKIIEINTLN